MVLPPPNRDRLTSIRIRGFRSIKDATLRLQGLTVLIGANGTGKSSILEVLETLRYFATPGARVSTFFLEHARPLRDDPGTATIEVRIDNTDELPRLRYEFSIFRAADGGLGVHGEVLEVGPIGAAAQPLRALRRVLLDAQVFDQRSRQLVEVQARPDELLLTALANDPRGDDGGPEQAAFRRVARVLQDIEVHLPFDTLPTWAARRAGRPSLCRESARLQPTDRLELFAANLANVWFRLKNEDPAHWEQTLELVRLGLGDAVSDIATLADAQGSHLSLALRYAGRPTPIPAAALSAGTLAFLAMVAITRLPTSRSVLAFDEPELHLHPGLLVRVVSMLESLARHQPVVVATHCDRLLDALTAPASSTVLCELDSEGCTMLKRPDAGALTTWMDGFRGFGELRAAGFQPDVMTVRETED